MWWRLYVVCSVCSVFDSALDHAIATLIAIYSNIHIIYYLQIVRAIWCTYVWIVVCCFGFFLFCFCLFSYNEMPRPVVSFVHKKKKSGLIVAALFFLSFNILHNTHSFLASSPKLMIFWGHFERTPIFIFSNAVLKENRFKTGKFWTIHIALKTLFMYPFEVYIIFFIYIATLE